MFNTIYNIAQFSCKWGYLGLITICTLRSICSGIDTWYNYICKRPSITLGFDMIDPVVNICMDTAYLAYYITTGGIAGFAISAFFPISIPIIMMLKKENPKEKTK